MNIEDYLVSEGIDTDDKTGFLDLLRPRLSEEQYLENEQLYEESQSNPAKGPKLFPKMYDFMAKHRLFKEFWQVNRCHLINNTRFITDNINGQKRILDVGCADGFKTMYYALNFPDKNFIGIDQCNSAIALAQEKAHKRGLINTSFVPANLYHLCFNPQSFDAVIATQVLHEDYGVFGSCYAGFDQVYRFDKQIKSLSEALAPRGIMLITLLVTDRKEIEYEVRQAAVNAGLKTKKVSANKYSNGPGKTTALNFVLQK